METMNFSFFLSNNKNNTTSETSLLSTNESQATETASILAPSCDEASVDAFGGKDMFGTCDMSNMTNVFKN